MKFSAIIVAAAALCCASVNALTPSEIGEVKGVPLVFEAPETLRQTTFVKGQAIIHSRSEDLATSNVAVPDATNPYVKSKESVGVVGVALSASKEEETASASSSSAWTIPLAVGGCAVAAVGIAGFVFMKKRTQKAESPEDEAKTPATGSPSNEIVDFKNDMETPV